MRERRGRGREREKEGGEAERERKKGERQRERDYDQFPTYLTYQHHLQQTSLQYGQRHKVQHLISYSNLLGHGRTDWTVSWATRLQFWQLQVQATIPGHPGHWALVLHTMTQAHLVLHVTFISTNCSRTLSVQEESLLVNLLHS